VERPTALSAAVRSSVFVLIFLYVVFRVWTKVLKLTISCQLFFEQNYVINCQPAMVSDLFAH
jgi:hypothetical protein